MKHSPNPPHNVLRRKIREVQSGEITRREIFGILNTCWRKQDQRLRRVRRPAGILMTAIRERHLPWYLAWLLFRHQEWEHELNFHKSLAAVDGAAAERNAPHIEYAGKKLEWLESQIEHMGQTHSEAVMEYWAGECEEDIYDGPGL